MITVAVTFVEQTLPSGLTFVIMRKTYKLFGLKVWESAERANF